MREIAELADELDAAVEEYRMAVRQLAGAKRKLADAISQRVIAANALERRLVGVLGGGIVTFFRCQVPLDKEIWLRKLVWLVTGQNSITVPLIEGWVELEVARDDVEALSYHIRRLSRAAQDGVQCGIEEEIRIFAAELRRYLGSEAVIEVE